MMNLVTYFYEKLNKIKITSILAFLNNTRCLYYPAFGNPVVFMLKKE